jgi:hypothetical protein
MPKPYQFPTGRRRAAPQYNTPAIRGTDLAAPEPTGLVHGQPAGSTDELRVSISLDKLGLEYQYQVPIYGGRMRRGGQVIDFVVFNPFPVPVFVNGEYWHTGQLGEEDKLKLATAQQYYNRIPVVLWGKDLQTQEDTDAIVRQELG